MGRNNERQKTDQENVLTEVKKKIEKDGNKSWKKETGYTNGLKRR